MPDTTSESKPTAGSETNPPSPPPSEPPTGAETTGFRYQSGPFAGLTAAEAAQKYDQDIHYVNQQYNTLAGQVQSYVQQMNQPQSQPVSYDNDPDLWLTDAQKAEARLTQRLQQQWAQQAQAVAQPIYQGQASLAKSGSQNDPRYADIWKKYGTEIDRLMAKVPVQNTINKEVWDQAAKLIKSEHADEIISERAQQMLANLPVTETGQRTVASLPEAQSNALQKIRESDYGKNHLDYLSDAQLLEQAKKMGNSIDEYADMVASTHVISHPKKPGEWVNQGLVRDYQDKR